MTALRMSHRTSKTPAMVGGEDRPEPACAGRTYVYDTLIEYGATRTARGALEEAREICGGCPLATRCRDLNAEEEWAKLVWDIKKPRKPVDPAVSARSSSNARKWHDENRRTRIADIEQMIAAGALLDEVCANLDVNPKALYLWCRRNAPHFWPLLKPEPQTSNQHRKRDEVAA